MTLLYNTIIQNYYATPTLLRNSIIKRYYITQLYSCHIILTLYNNSVT